MIGRSVFVCVALLMAAVLVAPPAWAGGVLYTVDVTGAQPVPGHPGLVAGDIVPIRWDTRCIPVGYRVNDTRDPLPNSLGGPTVTLADASGALSRAMDTWNEVETSYIEMRLDGAVSNLGETGFDFVNEISFSVGSASPFIISTAPAMALIEDSLLSHGDDLDGDGDADVDGSLASCADADGDGDVELAPGLYPAGTILDADIRFNSDRFRFTVEDQDADSLTLSVDLQAIATLELGHSVGLGNSYVNQVASDDGDGATMFPFTDTGDPLAELAQRTLEADDQAWASYHYPEGSSGAGPAQLQAGDVAFGDVYGLIQGEVVHGGQGLPVPGAHVFAVDKHSGETVSGAVSGTTRVAYDPVTGGISFPSAGFSIVDGRYAIPVPYGLYRVGLEPVDGSPVSAAALLNIPAQVGAAFGLLDFPEEWFHLGQEGAHEARPGASTPVPVVRGNRQKSVDLVTNAATELANHGAAQFIGFFSAPPGRYYAVRLPASQILAANPEVIHTALFHTVSVDASEVPTWEEALVTTGTVDPVTGVATLDLADPLVRAQPFAAQDNDAAPLYFDQPKQVTKRILDGIDDGTIQHVFVVLRVPLQTPFAGPSGAPPLISIGGQAPFGFSYISDDGGLAFNPVANLNFRFSLVSDPE